MSTLKECYEKLGGDYNDVISRLMRDKMVCKFMYKFMDDKSFNQFIEGMEKGDYEEALMGVHTLKGICQNLSFSELFECSNEATKALKEKDIETAESLIPDVKEKYKKVIDAISEYREEAEG